MKLRSIFLEALEDFDTAPLPGMDNGQVLELPNSKFIISIFPEEKKLLFTPQQHTLLPKVILKFVFALKQLFNISEINHKEQGIFEVVFDPRQPFDDVTLFIKEELQTDEEL